MKIENARTKVKKMSQENRINQLCQLLLRKQLGWGLRNTKFIISNPEKNYLSQDKSFIGVNSIKQDRIESEVTVNLDNF